MRLRSSAHVDVWRRSAASEDSAESDDDNDDSGLDLDVDGDSSTCNGSPPNSDTDISSGPNIGLDSSNDTDLSSATTPASNTGNCCPAEVANGDGTNAVPVDSESETESVLSHASVCLLDASA